MQKDWYDLYCNCDNSAEWLHNIIQFIWFINLSIVTVTEPITDEEMDGAQELFKDFRRFSFAANKDAETKEWLMFLSSSPELKENAKVFKGIPKLLRNTLWPKLSGSLEISSINPGLYPVRNPFKLFLTYFLEISG